MDTPREDKRNRSGWSDHRTRKCRRRRRWSRELLPWRVFSENQEGWASRRQPSGLALAVAAIARGDGVAMRTRFRMAEKAADALVELRTDDVLELASLVASLGVFDRERVLEQTLGKTVTAHHVAGAAAAARRQLHFAIFQFY